MYAPERDGDVLAAFQALQMDPGPFMPDLGGVGARIGHNRLVTREVPPFHCLRIWRCRKESSSQQLRFNSE